MDAADARRQCLELLWQDVVPPNVERVLDGELVAQEITAAQQRMKDTPGAVYRIPLVPLHWVRGDDEGVGKEEPKERIHLKLESLQPVGSFKLRAACNAVVGKLEKAVPRSEGKRVQLVTASAGNMGQGVAWIARRLMRARLAAGAAAGTAPPAVDEVLVVVPSHAPEQKLQPMRRLGARILKVPFSLWWQLIDRPDPSAVDMTEEEASGWVELAAAICKDGWEPVFVHPVCDEAVMLGNATIGKEVLEDLPHASAIIVPFGGGALACGIAAAVRAATAGVVPVYAVEVGTAAPLTAALKIGASVKVPYQPTFIDGMGGSQVIPAMYPVASSLLTGTVVVTPNDVARAVKVIAERNRVIVEGAGAAAAAAVLSGKFLDAAGNDAALLKNVVCICSGGGLEHRHLTHILQHGTAPPV